MKSYVEEHSFGRVARIPTPTPFPGLGDINSYLILPRTPGEGPVLIDTGVSTTRAWDTLGKGLAEFGFRVEDVALVLLTHAHPDHCGQAARIAAAAGCEIWIHGDAHLTLMRYGENVPPGREASISAQLRAFGVPEEHRGSSMGSSSRSLRYYETFEPTRLLEDGEQLELCDLEVRVVHTPGHCPEEVVYFAPDISAIFSGDHLLPNITPICLMNFPDEPGGERVSSLLQYRASLEKAEGLPARITFPSHGPVIDDHRALIESYRLHMRTRTKKIERLLDDEGPSTVFELSQRMFPKAWRDQLYLVLSEVIGHLDLLVADGRAAIQQEDEELRFGFVRRRDA